MRKADLSYSKHRPTLLIEALDPSLAFALAVVGAGFSNSGHSFHLEMTKTKRIFAADQLKKINLSPAQSLGALQALLLYNIVGSFSENAERECSVFSERITKLTAASVAERELSRGYHRPLIQVRPLERSRTSSLAYRFLDSSFKTSLSHHRSPNTPQFRRLQSCWGSRTLN